MPTCVQLISKETGKPAVLNHIDNDLCREMGVLADERRYYMDWFDIVGFQVACGTGLEKQVELGREWVRANPTDSHAIDFLAVLRWLNEHYTTDAWYQAKA